MYVKSQKETGENYQMKLTKNFPSLKLPKDKSNTRQNEQARTRGKNNYNWKGGKVELNGYISVYSPNHPNKNSRGYIYEHRLIMEKHIGRYLREDEIVHHKNDNRQDNRIENLELTTQSSHAEEHNKKRIIKEGKKVFDYDIFECPEELKGQLKIGDFFG
jgi:hypothetical protein